MLRSFVNCLARVSLLALGFAALPMTVLAKEAAPVAAKATAQAQAPLMWVIKDADSTLYLLGSIHLIKPGTVWMDKRIETAFASSDELWLEIADLDDQTSAAGFFYKYGGDPERKLTEGMSEAEIAQLEAVLKKYGLTLEAARNFKPWAIGLIISVKAMVAAGYDPALGVDQTLLGMARKATKPVKGFETIEEQMAMLGSMDGPMGRQYLKDTLDQEHEGAALLDQMTEAWRKGDQTKLEALIVDELKTKMPSLYDVLLVKRNQNWAPKIAETLNGKGTSLIVVGAGHLIGPDSVQAQLAKRGIKAEPLY